MTDGRDRWALRHGRSAQPRYFTDEREAKLAAFALMVDLYGLAACSSAAFDWFGLDIDIRHWHRTTVDQRYIVARRVATINGAVITLKREETDGTTG